MEKCRITDGLADYICGKYSSVAEIGIGHFPDVALSLKDLGITVFATDIYPFGYDSLRTVIDDVTLPDLSVYRDVDLLYSIRPPSELVPYMKRTASMVAADLLVSPLSSEFLDGGLLRHKYSSFYLWSYRR